MPRRMGPGANTEHSKDFKGTISKLIKSLGYFRVLLFISMILAAISSVCSVIAPNRLSDLANVVADGLPEVSKFENVAKKIQDNFYKIDVTANYKTIMSSKNITDSDKEAFKNMLNNMNDQNSSNLIFSFPEKILKVLVSDITIDNVKISVEDQLKFLNTMSSIDENTDMLKAVESLPKSVIKVIDRKVDMNKAKKVITVLVVLYVTSSLFGYIQSYLMATVSNNYAKGLRTKISEKINRLPLLYFDKHETGDVLSRVTNDVDAVGFNLNQSIATLVSSITMFFGSVIMMFVTNWIMAITALLSSIFGFSFMIVILKRSQKYFIQRQTELGNINGHIEEIYSGHNVVRCYNGVDDAKKKFSELNRNLYKCNRKSQFLSGIMGPMMGFIGNFGYVAVCLVGAMLTKNDVISIGVIVAFMVYVRLFTNPLSQIAQAMASLQSATAAAERVFEFLEEKEMSNQDNITESLDKTKVKGNIEFKNVRFSYDDSKVIIKDFSAKASKGMKIAIVGPTGAGKTTMVNLLMKFYEINSGDILIDGVSTKNLTRENIHNLFIMVLQDTWLFDGTIKENIMFNKKDITDEEIWDALKVVGIDHFVHTLPGGINATISDNDSISAGQRQLLTIARGMIENAPFLILDEATSNVDTRTEELVQKAMDKLTHGRTSFIIAHRLSTIKNADLILVMKDGDIIESGNHEELLKQNGFYSDLYNSQFEL